MTTVRVRSPRRQPLQRAVAPGSYPRRALGDRRRQFEPRRDPRLAGARRAAIAVSRPQPAAPRARRVLVTGLHVIGFLGAFAWTLGGLSLSAAGPAATAELAPILLPESAPAAVAAMPEAPPAPVLVTPGLRAEMRRAIERAAGIVGVDFGYLVAVAARESHFDPKGRAIGTTAAGLYQFTEDTWLRAVKVGGARHGLGAYAQQIVANDHGGFALPNDSVRARLMKLRDDPALAALMAAELALDNKQRLERLVGREVTPAETYVAHLLGVTSAARLLIAAHNAPRMAAADLLPSAARNNPGVFSTGGHALTAVAMLNKVTADFERKVPRIIT